jgi:hypothetical protein
MEAMGETTEIRNQRPGMGLFKLKTEVLHTSESQIISVLHAAVF